MHIIDTPPLKRRKLSDLLSVFGAHKSPTSVSRMHRDAARHSRVLDSFDASERESESDSEDELTSDHAVPRGTLRQQRQRQQQQQQQQHQPLSELPARSRRSGVTYARPPPQPNTLQKAPKKRKTNKRILASDTCAAKSRLNVTSGTQTARGQVRQHIALRTKPKRDAFLLANRDYFLPLLPASKYIAKIEAAASRANHQLPEVTPYHDLHEQPIGVKATMKPYQLQGLSFLVQMHENGMSSILGDEMGLGKTLQTLSLFQYLEENEPTTGELRPYLVVCPLSVLSSWITETKKWVPNLNVVRFHGPKTERERFKIECTAKKARYESDRTRHQDDRMDIFVTTYETFTHEQGWFKRNFVWRYCVLDEGHKIKNNESDISLALQGLSAEYRLLLTGTPLQNNLKEMWALLHWLLPEVFTDDTSDAFRKAFDLTRGQVSTSFMDGARQLLELIMLRRMKTSPGVNLGLPEKEEVLLYVPLTPTQRFWYRWLLNGAGASTLDEIFSASKEQDAQALAQHDQGLSILVKASQALDTAEEVDTTDLWAESRAIMQEAIDKANDEKKTGGWRKLMNLLMQLRKVCNHPYLLPSAAPIEYTIGNHVVEASSKFIVLDKLLRELVVKRGKKVLIFSGFTSTLNLCEELLMLQNASGASIRHARLDGGTARAQRNLSIRLFNDMQSNFNVMLLSTRAGGLGINLTSATDVVFLDEDFNPQVTLQAEARAHRIGQTRKVTIYKLCTSGTVEEQMMGRIRKKLYLSAKITESMRNIHTADTPNKKRKRTSSADTGGDDAPHLDTASLQSLIRRGARTLAREELKVDELLSWDWETIIEKCKDKPDDELVAEQTGGAKIDEQEWLKQEERVQTAVFEGTKHRKEIQKKAEEIMELNRADRRQGKNTTVEMDGYMINKESLNCADWEAVPTLAGKDPRLAEYKKAKRAAIENQETCQVCWDAGELTLCSGCPRSYHVGCLSHDFQGKAKSPLQFHCPQHECRDCGAKTSDAGGMIYRCRWCENGFCEDCLDWDNTTLIDNTLPEFEMIGFGRVAQAYFIECSHCHERFSQDAEERRMIDAERTRVAKLYEQFLDDTADDQAAGAERTPDTMSEIATPAEEDLPTFSAGHKKAVKRLSGKTLGDLTSDLTEFTSEARQPTPKRASPYQKKQTQKKQSIVIDLTSELTDLSDAGGSWSSAQIVKKIRR
ncbi:hypothetical protein AC579_2027 [Pseudocercospora musae]|uniref:ISWI chromatin-remodeling complex ATPase ISW2 n=1 Tax=Pseudocercospora musae TaxID=113226 RepID=A0A139IQZ2_9PEZI|nr:hypothetical protein AC579_2027 [Pseudocercospora musae]